MGILCSNCGFVNPDDRTTCIKCRSELPRPTGHITHHDVNRPAPQPAPMAPAPPQTPEQPAPPRFSLEELATVRREPSEPRNRETAIHASYDTSKDRTGHESQPQRQADAIDNGPAAPAAPAAQPNAETCEHKGRHTQDGPDHRRCTLEMVPDVGETLQTPPMKYSGKEVILNRQNTEPNNFSITSKEQAALIYNDGRWYIEDRSELKSTYLLVEERTELKNGDIIVLGDRKFRFNS